MIRVMSHSVVKTVSACPTIWEFETADGEKGYIRYRWGGLSVRVGGERVYDAQVGDEWDGCMDSGRMYQLMRGVIEWVMP